MHNDKYAETAQEIKSQPQKIGGGGNISTAATPRSEERNAPAETSHGPGTVLTSLFAKFGFKSIDDPIDHETASALAGVVKPGCGGCQELAMQMDAWGPDGCESHIDEIIDGIRRRASQDHLGCLAHWIGCHCSTRHAGLWLGTQSKLLAINTPAQQTTKTNDSCGLYRYGIISTVYKN